MPNLQYMELVTKLQQGKMPQKVEHYDLGNDGILLSRNKIYVPNSHELRSTILKEMHNVPYARHPRYQKIVAAVKSQYYWPDMKKAIVVYIAKCLECQKVKVEHRHLDGFLQPFPIPEWKWEVVTMDFITKILITSKQHDVIMAVVDKLTKVVHFIAMKGTHNATNVVDIYMREVAQLYGITKTIVSHRDPNLTSMFWKGLFKGFGTNMNFNIAYHAEIDGKKKRVNWMIEDMLRMYVMEKPYKWED
jgi:hypothetical protein